MSNASDFLIENGVLTQYVGPGGDIIVPEGVNTIAAGAFIGCTEVGIHVPASVESVEWNLSDSEHPFQPHGTFGLSTTVFAPTGSVTEREVNLKRTEYGYRFIPEGEPVTMDDSHVHCQRSFNDWRKYFNFSNRAKGSHISAYLRSSKLVYLPDNFGKPVVASIDKDAFPEDTAVMCSKRLFAKLAPANKLATIRAFLTDSTPFISEEQKHLREYIKKNRAEILEAFISAEDTELLRKCLTVLKNTDEVFAECLDITDRLENMAMKLFLLNYKNELIATEE